MDHYKNYFGPGTPGIANYQVWNEANITTFWTGTPAEMATLTKAAYRRPQRGRPGREDHRPGHGRPARLPADLA